jgi:YidC/Oxa1 family membrane protein insertase
VIDIFARPLGMLLKFMYELSVNLGLDFERLSAYSLAIIFATIVFKLALLPLTIKQTKSMQGMQAIQPKIKELQKKHKNDPQKLNEETMKLYKDNKVSPFGGCLPLLIQFPVLIGYFRVMQDPVKYVFESQAAFDAINKGFLWIIDISLRPTAVINGMPNDFQIAGFTIPIIAIISAITTYFYSKYSMQATQPSTSGASDPAQSTQKIMLYITPAMFLYFGYSYPVGFTIYWTVSNIFQIIQQLFLNKSFKKAKGESN